MRLLDHLNKLEYFVFIVESGSLLKASKRAHISQPQMSKIVRQLEDLLGRSLLIRSSTGVIPTQAGAELFKFSQALIKSSQVTELRIKSEEKNVRGKIRIGTYDSISVYFFPEFIKYLDSVLPDVTVQLATGRSETIRKKLQAKELDIGVTVDRGGRSAGIVTKTIYSDVFAFYVSPQIHSSFKRNLILFPDALAKPLPSLKKMGMTNQLHCDNLETAKSLGERGLGVALLPRRVAKEGIMNNRLVQFDHPDLPQSLSPHEIVISYPQSLMKGANRIIVSELDRFLELWSL